MVMLDAVSSGTHLTDRERIYWEKTKLRDKAILILFLTYGLRLSELQQLNVSLSLTSPRMENFESNRRQGKESTMPINHSVEAVVLDYLENERNQITVQDERDEDALFLSLQGKRMTQRAIRGIGSKKIHIHSAAYRAKRGIQSAQASGYRRHQFDRPR